MGRDHGASCRARRGRLVLVSLVIAAVLLGATGMSCNDIPFASSTFRDAAGSGLKSGVKSIVDAIIDGIFAVIEQAGRGDGSSTST
jgi:hypothetical protein